MTELTPAWETKYQADPDPSCNFNVATSTNSVTLYHYAPLQSVISGATVVGQGQTCTWTAAPQGGVPPFTYQWSGALTGDGPSVTGSFGWQSVVYLTLDVWDAVGGHSSQTRPIQVYGTYHPCPV